MKSAVAIFYVSVGTALPDKIHEKKPNFSLEKSQNAFYVWISEEIKIPIKLYLLHIFLFNTYFQVLQGYCITIYFFQAVTKYQK